MSSPVVNVRSCCLLWVYHGRILIFRRFSIHEGCKQDSCSVEYGASTLIKDTCSCSCTKEKPTFSLQYNTCVKSLPGMFTYNMYIIILLCYKVCILAMCMRLTAYILSAMSTHFI